MKSSSASMPMLPTAMSIRPPARGQVPDSVRHCAAGAVAPRQWLSSSLPHRARYSESSALIALRCALLDGNARKSSPLLWASASSCASRRGPVVSGQDSAA